MDERLRQDVAAWLEFYRELGIEEFYPRPPASIPKLETRDSRPETSRLGTETPGPKSGGVEVGPRLPIPEPRLPALESRPVIPDLRTPALPPQALNLFEAPPTRRPERETLEQIREDLGDCHRCRLAAGRKTIVFGQGNPHAELVFVGEGPGADEDEQGLPFVGRAGQLLNRMLQSVGIRREDVYICNIVKCRPPGNRTPERDEVEACSPFLFRQIGAIRPRLICCLGAPAVRTMLGVKEGILKIRGHFYDYGDAKALPTVHPAYILRNPREEKILREDFEKIRAFLRGGRG
jgi:uracil-DNA glycosylase